MKAVIVFVVVGGMVRASSVMTGCGLVVVALEAVLTCIVKWGKCRRPCVVSMTTLLILIKCNPIIGLLVSSLRRNIQQKSYLQFQILAWLLIMVSLTGHWPFVFGNWAGRQF